VQSKVVGACECSCTVDTAERLGSSVLANVSRQLVGTCKVPLTTGKVTTIRLLAYHTPVTAIQATSLLIYVHHVCAVNLFLEHSRPTVDILSILLR